MIRPTGGRNTVGLNHVFKKSGEKPVRSKKLKKISTTKIAKRFSRCNHKEVTLPVRMCLFA